MLTTILIVPLALALADLCVAQHSALNLTYAYSASAVLGSEQLVNGSFGLTALAVFNSSSIGGPCINATSTSQGIGYGGPFTKDGQAYDFTTFSQGVTNDGVPYQIHETGLVKGTTATSRHDWVIGGNYTFLSEAYILCHGSFSGSVSLQCYFV